ncbi:tetratricopeptide repeat protein [Pseudomonas sp. A1437]|uniref:tetratricopeptide repeat protein n=1 Tax=unclassified Pseudomonas TaxID=196821 RepID=UPI00378525B4
MMTQMDLDSVKWLHMHARRYARSGQHQHALVYGLMANQIAPQNVEILLTLARLFDMNGDGSRALKAIEHLAVLQGLTPPLLLLKSRILWNLGQRDQARQVFGDCLALQGKERS